MAAEIKVCGMRDEANIKQVMALKPDYMGFIFYEKSPRFMTCPPVYPWPADIQKVGVFVNAGEQYIHEKRIRYGLDILQLHGDETPEQCYLLKQSGARVMKAFRIDASFDFQITRRYEDYCDYFLFDTNTKGYGGSGQKFNWALLAGYNNARPVFLSGGIGPGDAALISQLEDLNLKAIDINSRFETEPAVKNIKALAHFIQAIRKNADHE